jgi:hypothetical protein
MLYLLFILIIYNLKRCLRIYTSTCLIVLIAISMYLLSTLGRRKILCKGFVFDRIESIF